MKTMRLKRHNAPTLVYDEIKGCEPCIIFAPGFRSHRQGTKALFLREWARANGQAALFYDPSGHGESEGDPADTGPSALLADLTAIMEASLHRTFVIVGSSMGGLVGLHALLGSGHHIVASLLVAPAFGFPARLQQRLSDTQRLELEVSGSTVLETPYDPDGYRINKAVIEDILADPLTMGAITLPCPVTIIHGMQDEIVPWQGSLNFIERCSGADAHLVLRRDGDHRLSDADDLERLRVELERLVRQVRKPDQD